MADAIDPLAEPDGNVLPQIEFCPRCASTLVRENDQLRVAVKADVEGIPEQKLNELRAARTKVRRAL